MNLHYLRALAVTGLVVSSSMVFADDAVIVYYDVVGNSASELRHQMNQKGPLRQGGERFDGHTNWHVAWSYRFTPTADGCKFTEVGIKFTATITLPRWAGAENQELEVRGTPRCPEPDNPSRAPHTRGHDSTVQAHKWHQRSELGESPGPQQLTLPVRPSQRYQGAHKETVRPGLN